MSFHRKLALTIPEAVAYSGIGRSSIYKLFDAGKLTRRKMGKRVLILRDELEELVRTLPTSGDA